MTRKSKIETLRREQDGISPVSGRPLIGRLERHHIIEKSEGGSNLKGNMQLLPIEDHLLSHIERSFDKDRSIQDRQRELDTAIDRLSELSAEEKKRLNDMLERRRRVRFY